jgi:hypothetical protein
VRPPSIRRRLWGCGHRGTEVVTSLPGSPAASRSSLRKCRSASRRRRSGAPLHKNSWSVPCEPCKLPRRASSIWPTS